MIEGGVEIIYSFAKTGGWVDRCIVADAKMKITSMDD